VAVSEPLTREQAARLLELTLPSTPSQVKRAYRRLARQHHPDRGGDVRRFHALQAAYQRLVADDPTATPVSRSRPSRTARNLPSTPSRIEVDVIRTDLAVPHGRARLTGDLLASALARSHAGPVHPVVASSRAPGAALNRVAGVLAVDLTSHLSVAGVRDDRGRTAIALRVEGGARRARRALDEVDLGGVWTRRRRTASTALTTHVEPDGTRARSAASATAHLERLLEELRWPLEQWTLTPDAAGGS